MCLQLMAAPRLTTKMSQHSDENLHIIIIELCFLGDIYINDSFPLLPLFFFLIYP